MQVHSDILVKLCTRNHSMVNSKKAELELRIEVDVPTDIINDKNRLDAVQNGLVQSMSKGLYEQGVSFRVNHITFKIK